MFKRWFLFVCVALMSCGLCGAIEGYPNFSDNPRFTHKMRDMIAPYLLPLDHPMKSAMDEIFAEDGVVKNESSLKAAGFIILHAQKKSFIRVVSHPKLPGYLVKVYIDTERHIPSGMSGWKRLTVRCIVAEKIKRLIARHGIQDFVVADKWVYPLPNPVKQKGGSRAERQPLVLLVKDMNIYNTAQSKKAWKKKPTRRTIHELYIIFSRGLGSAFLAGNLPYTHDGKFAFIDTEFGKRRLPLERVGRRFSPKMQHYWNSLLRK